MTVEEYAALERRLGADLTCIQGLWWRRVRPFFYRPLLPYEPHDECLIRRPGKWPAAFQHVVGDSRNANSSMSWLVLDQLDQYCLADLSHQRRRLIKNASRNFSVKRIVDRQELQQAGYAPYRSFYDRTRYRYRKDRVDQRSFDAWAAMISSQPKCIILGGYEGHELKAVSVSYRLGGTLLYATFFAETGALRQNLGELMFHELRQAAAAQSGLEQIMVRPFQGGTDHDRYYLIRGCRLVCKPARIAVPAPVLGVMRWCFPSQFARLTGAGPMPPPANGAQPADVRESFAAD